MANRMRSGAKEHYWRGQVSGWQSSGLGIRAYCQQHQLSEANFHAWRRELARRDQLAPPASATATPSVNDTSVTKPQTSSVTWMPVTLTEPVAPIIEVQLPSGVQLRIPCSIESLETILSALQRSVA
jgi:transposase-like protein